MRASKEQHYPSIFNDVIGPVMRGPSSSHCAAAVRIGRLARDLLAGDILYVLIEFDPQGSLASTHESQGSDMGIFAGFLGWDPTDERVVDSPKAIVDAGIQVDIAINPYKAEHPNTYKMKLRNAREEHEMVAISTGGGMIEITQIDGARLSIQGDYCETLLFVDSGGSTLFEHLRATLSVDQIILHEGDWAEFIEIKSQTFLDETMLDALRDTFPIAKIRQIAPVLPTLSRKNIEVPFSTYQEMLAYNQNKNLMLWELAVHYESARGGISHEQVVQKMGEVVKIMAGSIREGLQGTEFEDRILGYQSGDFQAQLEKGQLLDGGILNTIILYTTALMETKSAMGVIVAAPTAGACGGLPGAVIGTAHALGLPDDEIVRAMLAAGLIGVFIARQATFAAEVGGCQAECGSGSGMAAAALVTMAGGSTPESLNAASMALQNILGMICDPVANRVEAPCLGKNVLAASNALSCANMSMAGYDPLIPLDEVIDTMDAVGKSIPVELRCTALGGLSITPAAKAIEKRLAAQ